MLRLKLWSAKATWLCRLWPFALAFSTSLCIVEQPSEKRYSQKDLRTHLYSLFDSDSSSPQSFLSSNWQKIPANLVKITMVVSVFCHCCLPEEGNMIECCQCSEWYHENTDEEVWEKEETDWVCKECNRSHYIKGRN